AARAGAGPVRRDRPRHGGGAARVRLRAGSRSARAHAGGPAGRVASRPVAARRRRGRTPRHPGGRLPAALSDGRASSASARRRPRRADVRLGRARARGDGRTHAGRGDRAADGGGGACAGPRRGRGRRESRSRRTSRSRTLVSGVTGFITFLTDFGLQDDFVGTCHGVMKRIVPDVQIIDITHGIRPGRVLQGAVVLANSLPYMPDGVHLAVVDPGVGGSRRPLALQDESGRLYVGPDNGLLLPAADRFGGVVASHEIANPEYALPRVSRTFHGRDLFSPAAAHLAAGVPLRELGP